MKLEDYKTKLFTPIFHDEELYGDEIEEGKIYVIGSDVSHPSNALRNKWLVQFRCPCGCGDLTQLNLLEGASPKWQLEYRNDFHVKNSLTVRPSINKQTGCCIHYQITDNKIH